MFIEAASYKPTQVDTIRVKGDVLHTVGMALQCALVLSALIIPDLRAKPLPRSETQVYRSATPRSPLPMHQEGDGASRGTARERGEKKEQRRRRDKAAEGRRGREKKERKKRETYMGRGGDQKKGTQGSDMKKRRMKKKRERSEGRRK